MGFVANLSNNRFQWDLSKTNFFWVRDRVFLDKHSIAQPIAQ